MRVIVAMSGGVDSSVAAARLVAEGHEVVGVTLHLWDYPDQAAIRGRCCAPEDVHDARRVADLLGIPHYAFDRRQLFEKEVVAPFVTAYLEGHTPSPCVHCNRGVKFAELIRLSRLLAAPRIATGHYARIREEDGAPQLYRAVDRQKDQSYFLHMLGPEILGSLMFPLGEAKKADVRAEAARLGLPGASKGESQELCFVPEGRYDEFVAARADDRLRPGPIIDAQGRTVAEHSGIHSFTIGQRKKLGVSLGERAYVVALDAATGSVKLGHREELLADVAVVDQVSLAPDVTLPTNGEVAVRYRGEPIPARLMEDPSGGVRVEFSRPVPAVVSGQFAVFYRGERVFGGGVIRCSSREQEGAVA